VFVIYLATVALLLGLVVVVAFASLERLRSKGESVGQTEPAGRGDAPEQELLERLVPRLADALGLSVESTESDDDGTWWVCLSEASVVGGRYVFLSAPVLSPEALGKLRDRVRAESGLKGIAVAAEPFEDTEPVVLDDVVLERLDVQAAGALIDRLTAASHRPADSSDPGQSTDRGDEPDETQK
jgi:hypothetical protein